MGLTLLSTCPFMSTNVGAILPPTIPVFVYKVHGLLLAWFSLNLTCNLMPALLLAPRIFFRCLCFLFMTSFYKGLKLHSGCPKVYDLLFKLWKAVRTLKKAWGMLLVKLRRVAYNIRMDRKLWKALGLKVGEIVCVVSKVLVSNDSVVIQLVWPW